MINHIISPSYCYIWTKQRCVALADCSPTTFPLRYFLAPLHSTVSPPLNPPVPYLLLPSTHRQVQSPIEVYGIFPRSQLILLHYLKIATVAPCLDDLPMPLLDNATAQFCLGNNLHTFRSQSIVHDKFGYRNEKGLLAFPWKSVCITGKASNFNLGRIHICRGKLVIKAVATLEPTRLTKKKYEFSWRVDVDSGSSAVSGGVEQQSSTEPNDREKLRRMRISTANKGNTPWNKGRNHSPETLQRIRERTRLAMQDPKVKMKLMNLGHAQSEETRMKIGVGVRIGWEKRREKLMLQEICLYEWQNLIAEASRRGVLGEEELQWNSYKILDKKLKQDWVQSVEERIRTARPKGSKRAPKSLDQRRKISASISAKWADDPAYRNRVCTGLAKYHGITERVERKPRRKPIGDGQKRTRSPSKGIVDSDDSLNPEPRSQIQRVILKRSGVAPFKDPLMSSKLEMLKNIRTLRAAAESKKTEAIARAKLLIAEAEKAAKALEVAAEKSPVAQASLVETRKIIAEAVQSISSIDEGQRDSQTDGSISLASPELDSPTELELSANIEDPGQIVERKVNGAQTSASSNCDLLGFNFEEPASRDLANGTEVQLSSLSRRDLVNGKQNLYQTRSKEYNVAPALLYSVVKPSSCSEHIGDSELNGSIQRANSALLNGLKSQSSNGEKSSNSATVTKKKWVRGRLVEVAEES